MQQNSLQTEKQQTGRWSKEQHQRFMYAITQYGKDWKKVEQYVKTRSGSQVRSHAQKFFTKLKRGNTHQDSLQRNHQEFSETEFDFDRQLNNQVTPSTPLELVSLIRRQSKEEGGRINLQALKQKLEERHQQVNRDKEHMPQGLVRQNSYKSMSNILGAYQDINSEKVEKSAEDQSFLILLTKKYKKFFGKISDFDKLIDINNSPVIYPSEHVGRKRSFTLPQGSELSGDELDQKIEEIKKKINTQPEKKGKNTISKPQEKKEVKETIKSIQTKNQEILPALSRLATIQEMAREDQEFNSFRVMPTTETEFKASQPENKEK